MNRLKRWLRSRLIKWESALRAKPTPPDLMPVVRELAEVVEDSRMRESQWRRDYVERCHELYEARQMTGTGPWLGQEARGQLDAPGGKLRESGISAQGAFGDLELALQNVEWRREVNMSWIEFSRWGIQQIMLISRLYYIKNPIIRRLINVDAYYVFGRGVEVSSDDESLNHAIKEFLRLNDIELGQVALSEHQKRTNYDGNLFFVFFPDTQDSGSVPMRTIDATEIQDIITNPDDTTEEWYFRRVWILRKFDELTGATQTATDQAWYPAVDFNPTVKTPAINGVEVRWNSPVIHRKYGAVGKWLFGCPCIYPALDWAKAARRYLEACGTLAASHAQIAMTLTTKGGQQALAGAKQQLQTTVGPLAQVFDQNPTANTASIFASGPGTALAAFHSRGQGLDPSEVKEFKAMAAICLDLPPTFVGDMETSNLATATSLDRPTELAFMHKQEAWREVLIQIVTFTMTVQLRAPGGRLREALSARGLDPAKVRIVETPRMRLESGRFVYMTEAQRKMAGREKLPTDIEIKVTFPAIREGDIPALITATVEAMTLGNKGGQIVGIDEREGVLKLFEFIGVENAEEIVEEMYPSNGPNAYDPNRTIEDAAAIDPPISSRAPFSLGGPEAPGGHPQPVPKEPTPGQESLARLGLSIENLHKLLERRKKAA